MKTKRRARVNLFWSKSKSDGFIDNPIQTERKMEAKAEVFFDVCHLFFGLFSLSLPTAVNRLLH